MIKRLRQVVSLLLAVLLLYEQSALGQLILPNPDIYFSPVIFSVDKFRPIHLRYLDAGSPEGILRFMLDKGDLTNITAENVRIFSRGLVDYFLVGLSLPDKSFWVNLRPDRPDNIIDPELEKTDIGKVLLEADLNLKKDMAGLTSPRTPSGKQYWNKLYAKARELFGTEQVGLPVYTRPWIVPGEIIVRQSKANAYIYKADLKVMLEEDYLRDKSAPLFTDPRFKELNDYSSVLLRELVIPKLTQEVNSGRSYASLRQVYYSLIFARWFKEYAKTALCASEDRQGLSGKYAARVDSGDLNGLFSKKSWSKTDYFNQYKRSFRQGEYNESEFINTPDGQTVRQYVSGGISFNFFPGAAGGAGITVVNAANDLPFIPGTVGITLTVDNRVVFESDSGGNRASAEERVKAPDGGGNLRGSNAAYDNGKLESFLLAQGNPAGQAVIVKEMLGHREALLEIGSGRTIAAFALAIKNKDIGVIATDIYDYKAKEDIYRKFADEWKSGKLLGQEIELGNLVVLRAGAEIITYFPDNSLDYILLVSPELNAVEQLSGLIKNEEALRKLKPGGKIVIQSYWWGIDYYNSLFGEGFKFKRAGIDFLGVNLRAVSNFEGNDELYVWTKRDGGEGNLESKREDGVSVRQADDEGLQAWLGGIPLTKNKLLLEDTYFRSLFKKMDLQTQDIGFLWQGTIMSGLADYMKYHKPVGYGYLMTKNIIPEEDLPPGYPVVMGLRKPRDSFSRVPASVSDAPKVEVILPDRDIFLTSYDYNGAMGCVKLGFLPNGDPVALKANFFSEMKKGVLEKKLFAGYKAGLIAEDLGIGPRMYGFFRDSSGILWMVMDLVPGDFIEKAGGFITANTIEEFVEINKRVKDVGLFAYDFQYYITPAGHIVVMDTRFTVNDKPGIKDFPMVMEELLESASDEVRARFQGLSGGDIKSDGGRAVRPGAAMPEAANNQLSDNPYFRSLSGKIVSKTNDVVGRGVVNYIKRRKLTKYGYLMTSDIDPEKDLPVKYPVIAGLREPLFPIRKFPDVISDVTKVDVVLPDSDIFLASNYHNGSGGCVKLGFLLNGDPVALKTYLFTKGTKDFFEQELFRSYKSGVIADNLGIGPRIHGLFEDNDGLLWIVMDIVPGDFEPDDDKLVTFETIDELVEINSRLKKAGFSTVDFQYYITPGGHIVVIDTYFEASANPGIRHFAEEMTELSGYANKEVRERSAALMRGLGLKKSDGGGSVLPGIAAAGNINERAGQSSDQDAKGGIDFRSLPVRTQNTGISGKEILSSRPAAGIPAAGLDKEWGVIRELVNSGNIPAAAKIRDYWVSAGGSGSGEEEKILCCVMEIMRLEEEYAVPCEPGLLELLKALESGK